ncbi:hypothetical protein KEM55_008587, partial [Ascosphaera atra]
YMQLDIVQKDRWGKLGRNGGRWPTDYEVRDGPVHKPKQQREIWLDSDGDDDDGGNNNGGGRNVRLNRNGCGGGGNGRGGGNGGGRRGGGGGGGAGGGGAAAAAAAAGGGNGGAAAAAAAAVACPDDVLNENTAKNRSWFVDDYDGGSELDGRGGRFDPPPVGGQRGVRSRDVSFP